MKWLLAWTVLVVLLAFGSCSGSTLADRACPPNSELTYENFGASHFDRWCNRCHSAGASPRNGAPGHYTFDSRAQIERWRERIYDRAADENDSMPPGPDGPSEEERRKLGEWLACGVQ